MGTVLQRFVLRDDRLFGLLFLCDIGEFFEVAVDGDSGNLFAIVRRVVGDDSDNFKPQLGVEADGIENLLGIRAGADERAGLL